MLKRSKRNKALSRYDFVSVFVLQSTTMGDAEVLRARGPATDVIWRDSVTGAKLGNGCNYIFRRLARFID
jgi:hypothetical protein